MDALDKRLLRALWQDGRISWVALAEKAHLSASACQRRVESLLSRGIIRRFTTELDFHEMGYDIHAFVHVKVVRQNVESARDFRKKIQAYPEVQACYKLSGQTDFLLDVIARDIRALSTFLDEKLLALDGVADASSSIVLEELPCEYRL